MRLRILPALLILSLTACDSSFSTGDSSSNQPPASPGTPNPSPISPTPTSTTFIYRVAPNSDAIYRASVDLADGALTELTETTLTAGDTPVSVAVSPDKKFLFIAKSGPKTIDSYSINQTTGELTLVDSYPTTDTPQRVRVDPLGRFLYVVQAVRVESYMISATGFLNWTGGIGIGSGGYDVAIEATGKYLYKSAFGTGIQSYDINQTTGVLTNAGVMQGVILSTIKIDSATNRIFGPLYSDGHFYQFAYNASTGVVSFVNSYLPDSSVFFPFYDFELNDGGTKAYAVNNFLGLLNSYSINATTGAVSSLNSVPLPGGCLPEALERLKAADYIFTGCMDNSGKTLVFKIESDGSVTFKSSTMRTGLKVKSIVSVTL